MLQDNFEKKIKEELEARTIKPTKNSWAMLEEQLDSEEKKSRPLFWYLGIAASIVLGLFLITNSGKENKLLQENTPLSTVDTISVQQELKKEVLKSLPKLTVKPNVKTSVATQKHKKQKIKSKVKPKPIEKVKPIKAEVLAAVVTAPLKVSPNVLVSSKQIVSQLSEVDDLLHNAKQQLVQEHTQKIAPVSAEQLLSDVENRIELTFREKVFKTVKQNFNKVKTAVVERNKK